MIRIHCIEHFCKVRAFAGTLGDEAVASLERALYRYADDSDKLVAIGGDHAPHSFSFTAYTAVALGNGGIEWKFWYMGGIIYSEHSQTWGTHT